MKRVISAFTVSVCAAVIAGIGMVPSSGASSLSTIKIGVIADNTTFGGVFEGAAAAVHAINTSGGVDKHQLKLITCDAQSSDTVAATCGRTMIADHVTAVVTATSYEDNSFMGELKAAHIAAIGDFPINTSDYTSSNSFPLVGGVPALAAGQAADAISLGFTKPSIAYIDVSQAVIYPQLSGQVFKASNIQYVNQVPISPTETDITPYVASTVAGGTDAVILGDTPEVDASFMSAMKTAGDNIPVIIDGEDAGSGVSEGFGPELQGAYVVSWFVPPSYIKNPTVLKYELALEKEYSHPILGDSSENAWASVYAFRAIAEKTISEKHSITARSILATTPTMTKLSLGVLPTISFAKASSAVPGLTRIFNMDVMFSSIQNDQITVSGTPKFLNPFALK